MKATAAKSNKISQAVYHSSSDAINIFGRVSGIYGGSWRTRVDIEKSAKYYGVTVGKMWYLSSVYSLLRILYVTVVVCGVGLAAVNFDNNLVLVALLVVLLLIGLSWGPVLFESTLFKMGKIKRRSQILWRH